LGVETRVDQDLSDLYSEYKLCEKFGIPYCSSYEDMPAHRADWWTAFMRMDEEVQAELQRKQAAQQR